MMKTMPIGELARRTRCNIETIRYYERIGLIPAPPRRGSYRSYSEPDAARLAFIRRARELGFTLDTVRRLLALSEGDGAACTEARDLAAAQLSDVQARIADLLRMEQVLTTAVAACDTGEATGCPLIEALSAEAPSAA